MNETNNFPATVWLLDCDPNCPGGMIFDKPHTCEGCGVEAIEYRAAAALPPLRAREEIAREAQEAADRITRGLAISGWMPRRSNIETARNDLQKIADAILSSTAGQEWRVPEDDADKAFSEWAWLKTGEPIGYMAPHVAARLAFKAGAEWAAAPPVAGPLLADKGTER